MNKFDPLLPFSKNGYNNNTVKGEAMILSVLAVFQVRSPPIGTHFRWRAVSLSQ